MISTVTNVVGRLWAQARRWSVPHSAFRSSYPSWQSSCFIWRGATTRQGTLRTSGMSCLDSEMSCGLSIVHVSMMTGNHIP